jgi:hypothetical protein
MEAGEAVCATGGLRVQLLNQTYQYWWISPVPLESRKYDTNHLPVRPEVSATISENWKSNISNQKKKVKKIF